MSTLKRHLFPSFIILSIALITAVSCDVSGDECGPFDNRFKTIDFTTRLARFDHLDVADNLVETSPVTTDSIHFRDLALEMMPITQSYSVKIHEPPIWEFSFLSTAYACSPPIPISKEQITGIQIYSNRAYNARYTSSDNLAELFEVITFYRNSGKVQRQDLNSFLSSQPTVPDELYLVPTTAPATADPIQFTVRYIQDGIDLETFQVTTASVVVTG